MALISVLADKGGGVTTSAVALAAVWPREVLLAECDLTGGDLPYRLPGTGGRTLAQDRGIVSLATAARGQVGPQVVLEHTQQVDGGLRVLVGPSRPEQAAAIASAWTPISGLLAGLPDVDVLADCGRVVGSTALLPVLRRSSLLLWVARASVEGMAHLRHGMGAVTREVNAAGPASPGGSTAVGRMAVLLIADAAQGRAAEREAREVLEGVPGLAGVPVLGVLAHDPAGAQALGGRWDRKLDRSVLIRSARGAAAAVFDRVHDQPVATPAGPPAVSPATAPAPDPVRRSSASASASASASSSLLAATQEAS